MEVTMSASFDHLNLVGIGVYSLVTTDMVRMRREFVQRMAAERWRRYMLMVLDVAIGQCERRNLSARDRVRASDLACPELVADLIEQLQIEQGRHVRRPSNNFEALDVLFDLQRMYMPLADDEDPEEWRR
jgi:hypothetical protein